MSDYLVRPKSTPRGGILVLHAWWGLNDFFKELCDKLADEGYIILAVDIYDGKVAKTIPEAEKLSEAVERNVASKKILIERFLNQVATILSIRRTLAM